MDDAEDDHGEHDDRTTGEATAGESEDECDEQGLLEEEFEALGDGIPRIHAKPVDVGGRGDPSLRRAAATVGQAVGGHDREEDGAEPGEVASPERVEDGGEGFAEKEEGKGRRAREVEGGDPPPSDVVLAAPHEQHETSAHRRPDDDPEPEAGPELPVPDDHIERERGGNCLLGIGEHGARIADRQAGTVLRAPQCLSERKSSMEMNCRATQDPVGRGGGGSRRGEAMTTEKGRKGDRRRPRATGTKGLRPARSVRPLRPSGESGPPPVAETKFRCGDVDYLLERFPPSPDPTLRAWSAAEEHLLGHLLPADAPLVLGDPHGALPTVLAARSGAPIVRWTDSYLATVALGRNLVANAVAPERVEVVPSTADPMVFAGRFDLAVLLVPKSLALLEYMVEWLKPCLCPGARLLAAGMTRHLSPHVGEILSARLGPTQLSPVVKKSVVFTVQCEDLEVDEEALTPSFYELDGETSPGLRVFSFPGVFGGGRLDHGTGLLLGTLPELPAGARVLDLGCGSGVLALVVALRQPGIDLTLVDESHLAVASARLTFTENGLPAPLVQLGDGCDGLAPESFDLVISNPPFHTQHALTVAEATRLFAPVRAVLRPGGVFHVVGAHGVDYGPTLRRFFPVVERIASDRRYAVHRCALA